MFSFDGCYYWNCWIAVWMQTIKTPRASPSDVAEHVAEMDGIRRNGLQHYFVTTEMKGLVPRILTNLNSV
jgi:hypothetical protein